MSQSDKTQSTQVSIQNVISNLSSVNAFLTKRVKETELARLRMQRYVTNNRRDVTNQRSFTCSNWSSRPARRDRSYSNQFRPTFLLTAEVLNIQAELSTTNDHASFLAQ